MAKRKRVVKPDTTEMDAAVRDRKLKHAGHGKKPTLQQLKMAGVADEVLVAGPATGKSGATEMQLNVTEIVCDPRVQQRADHSATAVEDYASAMELGQELPPLEVFAGGLSGACDPGKYLLVDGFHRLEAHRRLGHLSVWCHVHQGDRRAALLYACGANAAHGLQRTNEDKRKAVETLLRDEEWAQWSDREIARAAKVGHTLVSEMRKELTEARELSALTKRIYKDARGRKAVMDVRGQQGTKPAEPEELLEQPAVSGADTAETSRSGSAGRNCLRCDNTGRVCMCCGESPNACECADEQALMECEACAHSAEQVEEKQSRPVEERPKGSFGVSHSLQGSLPYPVRWSIPNVVIFELQQPDGAPVALSAKLYEGVGDPVEIAWNVGLKIPDVADMFRELDAAYGSPASHPTAWERLPKLSALRALLELP